MSKLVDRVFPLSRLHSSGQRPKTQAAMLVIEKRQYVDYFPLLETIHVLIGTDTQVDSHRLNLGSDVVASQNDTE